MTIASAIAAKQQQVADAYTAISNKGGTLPATQDIANMPTAINSITGLVGETRTEQLNSTSGNTYTPSTGYNGITSITVTPKNYNRTVAPQTVPSTWAVPSGYSGHGAISVTAVTASIDANIQAGNIKSGVTILGVTGTYGGGGSKYGATVNTFLGDIDANGLLQSPSEQSDIVFTGVTDIASYVLYHRFNYSVIKSVSFSDLVTISGAYACYNMLYNCTGLTSVTISSLTTVSGNYACYNMFNTCTGVTTIVLSGLTTISGTYGCSNMFNGCANLETLDLSNLTTVSGNSGCYGMFQGCTKISTIALSKLSVITGSNACSYMFASCRAITNIYFNALTTSSFGSYVNQFSNMFNTFTGATPGAFTMHFPSNLSSTISGLTGYPNFGATAGRLTLAFDLPATS